MPLSRVICITLASHSAAHLLQSCCAGMALSYRLCPSLPAGTLSPCVNPGWASSASFLFWWQTLSSPCKHLDYTCICSVVHSQLLLLLSGIHLPRRFGCYQRTTHLCSTSCLKLIFFTVVGLEEPLSSFLEGALYKFSK